MAGRDNTDPTPEVRNDTAPLVEAFECIIAGYRALGAKLDHAAEDTHDLELYASRAEQRRAAINRRLDSIDLRLERIEHLLDSAEPPR
jgi:hypothetical protein